MTIGRVVIIAIGSILPLHLVLENLKSKYVPTVSSSPFQQIATFSDSNNVPAVSFVTIRPNSLPTSQVCNSLQQLFDLFDNVQKIFVLGTVLSQVTPGKIVTSNLQNLPAEVQSDFVLMEQQRISLSETILRYTLHFTLVSQIPTDLMLVPFQTNTSKNQQHTKKLLQTLSTAIRLICQTMSLDFQEGPIDVDNLHPPTQHSEGPEDMIYL